MRRMLPAVLRAPGITLSAIASRDAGRAAEAAAQFQVEPVHGYSRLLEREDIDAVYLPLPPALHAPWAARALDAGKHALVEKPMTTDAQQARELARLAEARSLVLMESFMFLHHSQHATVARLLREGAIGRLRSLTAEFAFPPLPAEDIRYRPELGGGALLDAGVYPLRLSRLLLGEELTVTGASLGKDPATGVDVRGEALLRSVEGVSAHLAFGFTHAYRCAYTLWGTAGRLVLDRAFTPPPEHQPVVRLERQKGIEELTLPPDDQFANIAARFAELARAPKGQDADSERETAVRHAQLVTRLRERAQTYPVPDARHRDPAPEGGAA